MATKKKNVKKKVTKKSTAVSAKKATAKKAAPKATKATKKKPAAKKAAPKKAKVTKKNDNEVQEEDVLHQKDSSTSSES